MGLLTSAVIFLGISCAQSSPSPNAVISGQESPASSPGRFGVFVDIQRDGPFMDGRKVTLEEAIASVPHRFPYPPTDEVTGPLTAVWIEGLQIAFVWKSDLRFYVGPSDTTEAEAVASWTQAQPPIPIAIVRGHAAAVREGTGEENPSSISWFESGLGMQFVGPHQSLAELQALAEQMQWSA